MKHPVKGPSGLQIVVAAVVMAVWPTDWAMNVLRDRPMSRMFGFVFVMGALMVFALMLRGAP